MKKTVLEPLISDESVIVQFSGDVLIDKTLSVTVPDGYAAFVFADEKVQFRIQPCAEKKLSAYGKELNGKKCFVAFVRTKPVPPLAWGFGNIQVAANRRRRRRRNSRRISCAGWTKNSSGSARRWSGETTPPIGSGKCSGCAKS